VKKPALLVVFVDAFGPDQAHLLRCAGLGLSESRALRGVLGYSSGALPTILTGASPSAHGRMCLFARAASTSPLAPLRWLGLLPRLVHERARVRRWAGKLFAAAQGYDGYFALHRVPPADFATLDVPEREDLFAAREIGGVPTLFARAKDAGLRVTLSDWRAPEATRVQAIEAAPDCDLAFLYLSGLDGILHHDGEVGDTAHRWARQAVEWISRARRAMTARGREVQLLVVGDHGMAKVQDVVDPRPVVRALKDASPSRFLFVDSTMLRVDAAGDLEGTKKLLAALPGEVLDAGALAQRDAPKGDTYGELIALLPEGSIFAPSYVGGRVRGMHGYDRHAHSARAALLSDGALPASLDRLEGFAPLVASRLGFAGAQVAS
jgi:hypothetical protein